MLFSGGYDSTFRLLQLASIDNVTIQPIYFIDKKRPGRKYEIKAMNEIIDEINHCEDTFPANVKNLVMIDADNLIKNSDRIDITNSFNNLREKYNIGIQYLWFALYAELQNIIFETGILCDSDRSKVGNAIYGEGENITKCEEALVSDRRMLSNKDKNSDVYKVFGRLALSVSGLSKIDEMNIAQEKGWSSIMAKTWFCHSPINGKPCGFCNPCKDAINEGMEWRLPKQALWRYHHRKNVFVRGRSYIHTKFYI
ncbi:hypothetical protein SAMN02910398_03706 [Butyrivibrio sp. YAB3001]|nr:hypothetical protein SAMN02910398_03706 [Butyrivibrio sp. YAB3001]